MDVNGKTRPASTGGIASPKAKGDFKEAEGIIKGNVKKAGGVTRQGRKP